MILRSYKLSPEAFVAPELSSSSSSSQKGHLVDALFNGVGSSLSPPVGSKWVAGGRLKRRFLLNN
jgi:hypothetical protein